MSILNECRSWIDTPCGQVLLIGEDTIANYHYFDDFGGGNTPEGYEYGGDFMSVRTSPASGTPADLRLPVAPCLLWVTFAGRLASMALKSVKKESVK